MSREEEMTTMTNIIYGLRHMGARDVNRTHILAYSDYIPIRCINQLYYIVLL